MAHSQKTLQLPEKSNQDLKSQTIKTQKDFIFFKTQIKKYIKKIENWVLSKK